MLNLKRKKHKYKNKYEERFIGTLKYLRVGGRVFDSSSSRTEKLMKQMTIRN